MRRVFRAGNTILDFHENDLSCVEFTANGIVIHSRSGRIWYADREIWIDPSDGYYRLKAELGDFIEELPERSD